MALLFFSLLRNMFFIILLIQSGGCSLFVFISSLLQIVQPSSRDLFVLISYIDFCGRGKSMGVAQIYMGVAQLIWLPCLASSKYTLFGYIQRLIKQTSLEFRQKYSSRMWVWLNYLLCHALLKKNPVHRGSVLMYTNIQFHT